MKYWILLLALSLCLCLFAGCNSHNTPPTEMPTEAATEVPTEAPTDAPTEAPSEAPTEAPAQTGVSPMDLVGTWEFAYTEVEGDISENGSSTITIYGEDENSLYITYQDRLYPEEDFEDRKLTLKLQEMYAGCSNDQWIMDVDYIGAIGNTMHTITLLENGTLVMQNLFTIEEMPMVSYQFFRKS